MRLKNKKQLLYTFLIFSLIGHFLSYYFYVESFNQIKELEMLIFYNDFMTINLVFSLSIGLSAVIFLIVRNRINLNIIIQLMLFVIITTLFGVCFVKYRIDTINDFLKNNPNKTMDSYDLYFENYWGLGLFIGSIIYYIIILISREIVNINKNISK